MTENTQFGDSFSDRELIERIKNKDTSAFEILHKRYRKAIMNFAYRFTGNYETAEDATQDTFIKVYENAQSYKPTGSTKGWIYTIASNTAKNILRKTGQFQKISLDTPISYDKGKTIRLIDTFADEEKNPEKLIRQKELEEKVQEALKRLPEKYREVLVLCGIEGLSYDEAAEVLDTTPASIGVRLMRAREMMKEMFGYKKGANNDV